MTRNTLLTAAAWSAFLVTAGCGPEAKTSPNKDGKSTEKPTAGATTGTASGTATPAKSGTGDTQPAPSPPAKPPVAVAPSGEPEKILLGTPELTAGIPGSGPLKADDVKKWLADERNHRPLDPQLPLGLSLGQLQIVGLKENPLTRAKIELGRQLYFDPRLSKDNTISCATCHIPANGYAAATQFGVGIRGQMGDRNSPVAYNRILSAAQFWDGRAATLEDQAVGPIQNPIEMGNTHDACVATVAAIEGYRLQFAKIFGGVTIQNVGKAIASFERAVVTGSSPYDYNEELRKFQAQFTAEELAMIDDVDAEQAPKYKKALADAKANPMNESAQRGRALYFTDKAACATCHVGANFTDEKYHNLGVGMDKEKPDLGYFATSKNEKDKGAFKTPTLRNVAMTGPYMHDGSQKTLEEVIEWYAKGGHPNPHLSDKIKKLNLSDQDKKDLVEFMKALTGPLPKVEAGRLPE